MLGFFLAFFLATSRNVGACDGTDLMSRYEDDTLNGKDTTEGQWNDYLKRLHARIPGVTNSFSRFPTTLGPDTYTVLFETTKGRYQASQAVLDLGCGEGFFTRKLAALEGIRLSGIDLSESEIALARTQQPGVDFRAETIAKMSFKDAQFDLVSSHLVLMMVEPIEPALREVARVLKPGGSFVFAVTRPQGADRRWIDTQKFALAEIQKNFPKFKGGGTGDARVGTDIESLLKNAGFSGSVSETPYDLIVEGTPERVWNEFFGTLHRALILPQAYQAQFREAMIGYFRRLAAEDGRGGQLTLRLPLRLVVTTR